MHPARHARLSAWLSAHHGVISRQVLLRAGHTPGAVRHLVASGWLEPYLLPGIYRSPAHAPSRSQILTAVCLYSPAATIGLTTAGQELGMRRMIDPLIHVLLDHALRLDLPGVVVHRCRRIDPVDIALPRRDGVRITSPPRTLLDAASILEPDALESAIEQALADRMCTMRSLLNTSARLHHGRRPGAVRFREVLQGRPLWRQAAPSDLEIRFRRAIAAHGLPEPVGNSRVEVGSGRSLEVDLVWPDQQVAGEVDHPFWHDATAERRRDRRRDRQLAASGLVVVRFDEVDVEHGLDAALSDLRAVLVERGWRPPLSTAS